MLLDIYKDALEYSMQDKVTLLKLGICMLLSVLIVPLFLVLGYEYRVLDISTKGMVNGNEKLPEFNDLVGMFVDGLKVFLVNIVYMIIPILIYLAFAIASGGLSNLHSGIGNGIGIFGLIVFIIVLFIFFFMSLMAVTNMVAHDGALKKAFDFEGIWNIIDNIGWFRYVLFYIGLIIAQGVIVALTAIISVILQVIVVLGLGGLNAGVASLGSLIITFLVFLVFSLILQPYMSVFRNRALGLIYEPVEE